MKLSVSFNDSGKINKNLLVSLFENYGHVSNVKVFRALNSVSRGALAIVEMNNDDESELALQSLNGQTVEDVLLKVGVSHDWVRGKNTLTPSNAKHKSSRELDDDEDEDYDDDYNEDDDYEGEKADFANEEDESDMMDSW